MTGSRSKASGAGGLAVSRIWLRADHDLRQPVQSLAMLAHALTGQCTEQERLETAARITLVSASLNDMLATLALMARLADGVQAPASALGSTSALADRVLADLGPVADGLGIAIGRTGSGGTVRTDLALVQRALRGIVLFALKFGTGREITIDCRPLKAQVAIDVVYEGPDPSSFVERQAFVDLSPSHATPPRLLQDIGLAFVAALSASLGIAFSHGQARGRRRRLSLRFAKVD